MADETIGVARIGVDIDAAPAKAGANEAKQAVREIGVEVENSSKKQVQATKRQEDALKRQIDTLGLSREEVIRYRIAQQTSGEQAQRLTAALDKQTASMKQAGISTGQYNNAMRMLPAQYTDIVTQIAGGQNLGLILLQQGGQIRDSFGSISETFRGVGQSLGAVINPVTALAAAFAAMGIAAYQGSQESTVLNAALITSGNTAGVTTAALQDLAAGLDSLSGVTTGKAVEALAAVNATGSFTAEQMKLVAQASLEWSVATGTAVDDTVKQFVKLADDPVKAILDLNKNMNFLTEAQVESIRLLVEQGRQTEAATEAIRIFASTLSERSGQMVQNLGSLERGWRAVKGAISEAWDALKSIGRDQTVTDQIRQLESNIQGIQGGTGVYRDLSEPARNRMLAEWRAKLVDLQNQQTKLQEGEDKGAQAAARALSANNEQANKLLAIEEKRLTVRERMTREATRAGVTDMAGLEKLIQAEERREAEAKAKRGANAGDGGLGIARLAAIRQESAAERDAVAGATRELQAEYSARTISANDYYAKLRALTEQGTAIEVESIRKQIAVLDEQTGKRVASGVVAQQKAALEAQLTKAQEDGASRLRVLATQEETAQKRREDGLRTYREALQASTAALSDQMAIMVARVGSGEREFEIQQKINEVYAEQAKRLRDIAREQETTNDPDAAARKTADLQAEVNTRVETIRRGYDALAAAQADWGNGFTSAVADYATQASDIAGQIQSALTNVFSGLEDVIVEFTQTGKLNFSDLANSILADMTRIATRQALSGALQSGLGAVTNGLIPSFGFAEGGWTGSGSKYEPKGVVHANEVVWSSEDVSRAGGVATVEAMRKGKKGYSNGGSPSFMGAVPTASAPVQVNLIGLDRPPDRQEQSTTPGGGDVLSLIWDQMDARNAEGWANGTSALYAAANGR